MDQVTKNSYVVLRMNLSRELKYVLAVSALSLFVISVFGFVFMSYYFDFVTEFLAVVLGIALVFYIDRYSESEKNKQDRRDLLRNLRVELVTIKGTAKDKRIYTDIWDSAISSGKLSSLISSQQVIKLTRIYRSIRELDNERRLVEQIEEDYYSLPGATLDAAKSKLFQRLQNKKTTHENNTHELNEMIEEILQDEELWLSTKTTAENRSEILS